jgi:hypothetical protein
LLDWYIPLLFTRAQHSIARRRLNLGFALQGATESTGEVVAAGDDGKALVFWKCPLVPNSEQKPIPSYDQKKVSHLL